jgi:hypothetical protein
LTDNLATNITGRSNDENAFHTSILPAV